MSFQEHYYRECVAEWIEKFNDCDDNEILLRNILSRAYYTVFLHCENVVREEVLHSQKSYTNKIIDHNTVIHAVKNTNVRDLLFELKRYRERADYNAKKITLQNFTSACKKLPSKSFMQKELLVKIDTVLEYKQ